MIRAGIQEKKSSGSFCAAFGKANTITEPDHGQPVFTSDYLDLEEDEQDFREEGLEVIED
jgi:hypothetical protein